jgi:hypothetical protein
MKYIQLHVINVQDMMKSRASELLVMRLERIELSTKITLTTMQTLYLLSLRRTAMLI